MTVCELRERNRQSLYSIPRKKIHSGYKKPESPNKAILDCLAHLDIPRSQAYFWTPNWISAEKDADEDIKENRVQVSKTADEIIKYLNSQD
jgi:hypothetical protein